MKKFIKVLAKIAKVVCLVIFVAGAIGIVASLGFTVYLISLNTHHGFIEMSDSATTFVLSTIHKSTAMFLIGAIGFFKFSNLVKKPAI